MKLFYCVQIAIWTWTGFSCKYLEERRKDYVEMMLHHCVTIALMLFSQINNQHAIGLVVVFCHDLSDVFLDLMKMSNYLKPVAAGLRGCRARAGPFCFGYVCLHMWGNALIRRLFWGSLFQDRGHARLLLHRDPFFHQHVLLVDVPAPLCVSGVRYLLW